MFWGGKKVSKNVKSVKKNTPKKVIIIIISKNLKKCKMLKKGQRTSKGCKNVKKKVKKRSKKEPAQNDLGRVQRKKFYLPKIHFYRPLYNFVFVFLEKKNVEKNIKSIEKEHRKMHLKKSVTCRKKESKTSKKM